MYLETTLNEVVSKNCTIEIFGLGYGGFPLSIRLARSGFPVIGVNYDAKKN